MQFHASIDIHAAPDAIWPTLIDVERWPEWTASISRVERLEPGPLQLGSRARVSQPRLTTTVYTVTQLQALENFTWVAGGPGVKIVADHSLSASQEGSTRLTLGVRFEGPLGALIGRVYGGLTQRYLGLETAGLKRRVEAAGRPLAKAS